MNKKQTYNKSFSFSRYVEDVKAELKKVDWPNKKVLTNSTLTILVIVILLTAYVSGIDFLVGKLSVFLKNSGVTNYE